MIYRGPGFLTVVWFGSSPTPFSREQVVSLSQSFCVSPDELIDGWVDGQGTKSSYDGEKAWPSINHSIISSRNQRGCPPPPNYHYVTLCVVVSPLPAWMAGGIPYTQTSRPLKSRNYPKTTCPVPILILSGLSIACSSRAIFYRDFIFTPLETEAQGDLSFLLKMLRQKKFHHNGQFVILRHV